ncbi:MAG: bifunctional (p)ppGpp synthetase/guanosine-3',5'-bis(diphosphate) 3'-pyrophosphohydrolase [Nitrospinota bacterium]|nr:bifunctional (p)ppGpp synthetase/guanosine-3',5'-bis(diphosphate) 3'-pyrophosphohydrolase [Nitrospinota bacterium]
MLQLNDITDAVLDYHSSADLDVILDAYVYSAKAHRGQSRVSGEAYFSHPVEVAYNLTRLKMDEKTVAAGLLHDTLEDTLATPEEIQELFGEEIYQLVEGVTKISKMKFSSLEESQAENYRKMILAMSKDIRVVLIKLADRAHNLQTLNSLKESTQKRIARETLEIYSPIANRLGIGWMKAQLENGAFKYLYPEKFKNIQEKVELRQKEREKYVGKVRSRVAQELENSEIVGKVLGRPKHYYSVYKKMVQQNISFEDVYDLTGVRVLTQSLKDCYAVLGLVHSLWKPIPGRFKDYIAMPKPNMYQSLHTTVIGPEGERVEVQIRTEEMHKVCEEGIAAHWQYKEDAPSKSKTKDNPLVWVRHLLESQKDFKNPKEFLNAFKVDLFSNEVYVFTPQGEVISMVRGATPVDFAYAVHTDIGHHCTSAKVNGKIVPLRYKLRNGDQVEVTTSKQRTPNRDWLAFVKTPKARSKIASFLNQKENARSLSLGRGLLEREIQRYDEDPATVLKGKQLDEAIHASGFGNLDSLLRGIGIGKISAHHVVSKLLPKEKLKAKGPKDSEILKLKEKVPPKNKESAIKVTCFDEDILLRVGKCCNPVPGDPIIGYITRGRGVTVHHFDCPSMTTIKNESERLVDVEWGSSPKTSYSVRISIVTEDKPGLLASISNTLAKCGINITQALVKQGPLKRAYFDLNMEIQDLAHLNSTFDEVRKVDGVIHLERIKEYSRKFSGKKTLERKDDGSKLPGDREYQVN